MSFPFTLGDTFPDDTVTELQYFTVTGYFYDLEQPRAGGTTVTPLLSVMSGYVTFTPRLPETIYVAGLDTGDSVGYGAALAVNPIQGQIVGGQLCSINIDDTPGVSLLSNTAGLALADQGIEALVYDVAFTDVVYAHQAVTLTDFAFVAPTDSTSINITDPALERLDPLNGTLSSFTVDIAGSIKLVAGVPHDGAFASTPVNGTLAIDTSEGNTLYVRVSGTWQRVGAESVF